MTRNKIVVIVLILSAGIAGIYFIFIKNNLLSDKKLSNLQNTQQIKNFSQEVDRKDELIVKNPIQWLTDTVSLKDDFIQTKIDKSTSSENFSDKVVLEVIKEKELQQDEAVKEEILNRDIKSDEAINNKNQSVVANVNPNLTYLEYTISEIKKIGKKQKTSDEDLLKAENALREIASTSTNFMEEFYKKANIKYLSAQIYDWHFAIPENNFFGKILLTFGLVKPIQAAAPLPFGGTVLAAFPCAYPPGAWLLVFKPLPPTYATLLSYVSGTQLYAWQIPVPHPMKHFFGFYLAGVQACVPVPNWGMITPYVGSSFL